MRPPPSGRGPVVLAADVGGTKTLLGLFSAGGTDAAAPVELFREARYPSRDAASLEEIVADFLGADRGGADYACFGLPGPAGSTRVRLVNLPWEVDSTALAAKFGLRGCFLINDLLANAHGIGELKPEDFAVLHEGNPHASGNMAVISPGTGLGEAGIFYDGRKHIPFASEGGHADFAPRNSLEAALLDYLLQSHAHVSCERVLSGSLGIPNLYRFLCDTGRTPESPAIAAMLADSDPGAVIGRAALEGTCPLCAQTMDLFVTILGAEAGNLALKVMATGGVYIGGGIAAKILPLLRGTGLREAFFAKGRFSDFMRGIPLRVILNDRAALLGAARYALNAAEMMKSAA